MTCGRYGHKSKEFWHRKYLNVPKFNYCDKLYMSINTVTRESRNKNQRNKNNKDNNNKCNYWKLPIRKKMITKIIISATTKLQTTSQKM